MWPIHIEISKIDIGEKHLVEMNLHVYLEGDSTYIENSGDREKERE